MCLMLSVNTAETEAYISLGGKQNKKNFLHMFQHFLMLKHREACFKARLRTAFLDINYEDRQVVICMKLLSLSLSLFFLLMLLLEN